ncbi:MAG TPA: bifunctional glutamate N-acetyltransferase/amino-acid acetyltransferase ArgJ [Firmicutes bacterium]|nr:bifunctional glutamate N-acetyltransferase/amino-acid acetyltransferase ArgJ [Bacillota bacterium]
MNESICDVRGMLCWGAHVGIKSKRRDLALIYSEVPCDISAVFTRNQVVAEPVKISREHARDGRAQAVVINAGNANACTGEQGRQAAEAMVTTTAEVLGIPRELVLVASTGVIGQRFPTEVVVEGIRRNVAKLSNIRTAASFVANAILTTDTFPKEAAQRFEVNGKEVLLAGVAKGSGMIHPDMGTMLAFLCCDLAIERQLLDRTFREAIDASFNMITVDGDTSTNDMALVMCNGLAGNHLITSPDQPGYADFREALFGVCTDLAKLIVSDGEGATKFIEYRVINAPSEEAARRIVRVVSDSTLVKTAFYGRDPNWGRILAAAGRAGVVFDPELVDLSIGAEQMYQVARKGRPTNQDLRIVRKELSEAHLRLVLNLNQGKAEATGWGSDLSEDYVHFNSQYTS